MPPIQTGKVFISHATDDKALAETLSELIQVGIGLNHSQIFCTSLAGQGIPAGKDFKHHIQGELHDSVIVIALLTPNFYASAFCLCELGGTWVLSKDFLPVVTPLAGYGDLKAVLKGVQAIRIDEDAGLDEIRDRLAPLASTPAPTPIWSVKKKKFLDALPKIIAGIPKPWIATIADLTKATNERDGYRAEARTLESELETLKLKYQELANRKDSEAVREIELQFSGEEDQFESLKREVAQAMKPLPYHLKEALYYFYRGEDWLPLEEDWDRRIDDCIERGLLKNQDPGLRVNEGHPLIRPAISALNKLDRFVDKASEDFYASYEREYKDELSFKSRGFWEQHI